MCAERGGATFYISTLIFRRSLVSSFGVRAHKVESSPGCAEMDIVTRFCATVQDEVHVFSSVRPTFSSPLQGFFCVGPLPCA